MRPTARKSCDEATRIFVQARLGSTRLPRKMLAMLGDMPIFEWVIYRLKNVNHSTSIHLLTSDSSENYALADIAARHGVESCFGSELDVASRFTEAAEKWPARNYVRVCADNPFVCPREIDRLISFHEGSDFDYSFNHIPALDNNYVDGFGAEIFTASLMNDLRAETLTPDEKEHVTRLFWNHRERYGFGILNAPTTVRFPNLSFDIDLKSDFEKFESILEFVSPDMTGEQILRALNNADKLDLFANAK